MPTIAQDKNFQSWLSNLKDRLRAENISEKTIDKYLPSNIELMPKVIEFDRNQPESKLSFREYYDRTVNATMKKTAIELMHKHEQTLEEIEEKYKVGKEYIVALWAIESHFGKILGKYPIINSLVTLAYDGRRQEFFEGELTILLKLIDAGKIKANDGIIGSWAGAMGHFQFMPSSCYKYGVDYNNDGQVDLRHQLGDAFASAANYLSTNDWQYEKPTMQKVTVPMDFDLNAAIEDKKVLTVSEWKKLGIIPHKQGRIGDDEPARLITLEIKQGKLQPFLVYKNFEVIRDWNKSNNFVATVTKLAIYIQTKTHTKSYRAQDGSDGSFGINGGDGGDGAHGYDQAGGHGGKGGSGLFKGGDGGRGGDSD